MRKSRRIFGAILLFVLCGCGYTACSPAQDNGTLRSGLYLLQGQEEGPYLYWDTIAGTWRCGAGIAFNYSLGGKFRRTGDRITANTQGSSETVAECQILSASKIKAVSVKKDFFPGESWFREGQVFELRYPLEPDSFLEPVCSAEEGLAWAKGTDAVVFENSQLTAGGDIWDAFYRAVQQEKQATVLCAHYYTLDPEGVSEELYRAEKDQYPKLFFTLVQYDGVGYQVMTRASQETTAEVREMYSHLLHFTGDNPAQAKHAHYDCYVLADDPSATWEGILAGMVSAQADAGYRHHTVYRNFFD